MYLLSVMNNGKGDDHYKIETPKEVLDKVISEVMDRMYNLEKDVEINIAIRRIK